MNLFFILFSVVVIIYLTYVLTTKKRFSLTLEVFYLFIYLIILLIFLFPNLLNHIELLFGMQSAINFIIYLSIFVAYLLIFYLYRKTERQRKENTQLVREIAYLKEENKEN